MNPSEINLKLFELVNKDYNTKVKTSKFVKEVVSFIKSVDHVTGCMLAAIMTKDLLVKIAEDRSLLNYLVPKFISVHTPKKIYEMLYVRYKSTIELLPREAQIEFNNFMRYVQ